MGAIYGVTPAGFVRKRLSDIRGETVLKFQEKFGSAINLDPRGPMGIVKNIFDEQISLIWEALEECYNSQYPNTSEGVTLDNVASITGTTRKQATPSVVKSGVARGTFGTVIPSGTVISVQGDSSARFATDANVTIDQAAINEVQKISFTEVPTLGAFNLTTSDEQTVSIPYNALAIDVQNALNNLVGFSGITVSGNFTSGFTITYAGSDGGQPQTILGYANNTLQNISTPVGISISRLTAGDFPKATNISLTAEETGATQALAGTLTVIETAVSGLDSFTNTLDAEVGNNEETDAELKNRRMEELGQAGAATPDAIRAKVLELSGVTACVVFMNIKNQVDVDGRPPHSVDVVVQGGDEDEIAEKLFVQCVAAGIETIGTVVKTVIDSQGFPQTVKFSRPTEVDIYLEVDLTTDINTFPADGEDQAEAALLAFGETLQMGQDVIVYPSLVSVLNSIPGITDVAVRIGTSASPTLDDNIVIAAREIASFDSSRTTVTKL